MKHTLQYLMPILLMVFLASCEDEKVCTPPSFKGFTYAPATVHPGDTVTVTACYQDRGEYIISPKYKWTVSGDSLNASTLASDRWTISYTKDESISSPDPSFKFAVPQSAIAGSTITCTFHADYSNAVDGVVGNSVTNTTQAGYYGSFSPSVVNSTLYSEANGRLTFNIASE